MSIYLFVVIVLFFLAVTGLVVGVTNDAVNFLNSARGAKAAKNWVIMLIASLGVLISLSYLPKHEFGHPFIHKIKNLFNSPYSIIYKVFIPAQTNINHNLLCWKCYFCPLLLMNYFYLPTAFYNKYFFHIA